MAMAAFTPTTIFMIFVSVAAQIFGLFLIPMTKGFTQPLPTLGVSIAFIFAIGLMARVAYSGVNLSVLAPMFSAIVPLAAITVGILVYGETVSPAKLGALVTACVLVGVANLL
jgi:multidrug transporter EmrE-like cation transporter